ncbi:exosortase A-associated hydrolase 1 [Sphingomonas aerophila]|uniref:Exosortase A-associated hydrolase 1 n=1 Tax=Sphingomonas aerophila TaxID=1344948 RepID=A0A7W9BDT2_9SPHN|nr:hydrolase 1, exosortase A system-associated [Sphingomonas aerophila]MBB5715405.1 exosortase A-associated hydrolase 1 [Sphingomonas aerophila]
MRRVITFTCDRASLLGTLDAAPGATGLLILSGGNEVRAGAHRGMALLAAKVASAGYPVFRFDRRGVGDSEGENGGWESVEPDLMAALAMLRREQPQVTRVVALGNCDAATALARLGARAGVDALVLTNPWTGDDADGLPPAAAIRQRYGQRLRDPAMWRRALSGNIAWGKLLRGMAKSLVLAPSTLLNRMAADLAAFPGPLTLVLARGDATAIGFRAFWTGAAFAPVRDRATLVELDTTSHSFQHAADAAALEAAVLAALTR